MNKIPPLGLHLSFIFPSLARWQKSLILHKFLCALLVSVFCTQCSKNLELPANFKELAVEMPSGELPLEKSPEELDALVGQILQKALPRKKQMEKIWGA